MEHPTPGGDDPPDDLTCPEDDLPILPEPFGDPYSRTVRTIPMIAIILVIFPRIVIITVLIPIPILIPILILYFSYETGKIQPSGLSPSTVMTTTRMMIMAERTIMTEHITASEARDHFKTTFNRVAYGHERVVVTRHKDEGVAVIPVEDLRLLERLERQAEDAIDAEAARRVLADPNEGRESWEDVRKDLGL